MPPVNEKSPEVHATDALTAFSISGKIFPPPFWRAPGGEVALYQGNCIARLADLPARSVHCVVTSPPYWNLRDYGTATWEGGSEGCDHVAPFQPRSERANVSASGIGRGGAYADEQAKGSLMYRGECKKCGAKRIDQQLGAEPSPDCGTHGQAQCGGCFVCSMVAVFRGVHRVLRDDGTLWLNLGDSYAGAKAGRNDVDRMYGDESQGRGLEARSGPRPGNLVGIPWRVALALQVDGWVLRQDIIWYAPNKMPESVQNRCTKSHEHIFMLCKGNDYYYDAEAIKDPTVTKPHKPGLKTAMSDRNDRSPENLEDTNSRIWGNDEKNKRDVWIVPTQGYPGAHFATYSPKLIEPCILAGTSEHGCCSACGTPWERVVVRTGGVPVEPDLDGRDRSLPSNRNGITGSLSGELPKSNTLGWRQVCGCKGATVEPCVVLDPFTGSGTTQATAVTLGRRGLGIDLSETYLRENAVPRITAAIAGEKISRKVTTVITPGTPPKAKAIGSRA